MSEYILTDKKLTKKELLEERLNIINMLIETNIEDKIRTDVKKFIEINKENQKTNIEYVNKIYEEIINLKFDLIKYDDIKKYDIKNIKELNILKKEVTEIQEKCSEINILISLEKDGKNKKILKEQLCDLYNKNEKLNNKNRELLIIESKINKIVKIYNIKYSKSILIKYCEILKILQEKRNRLLKIYEDFVSEDFVEELLFQLYEKKIDL